ncbi:hypothetical protein [Jiangella alba]|uniref:WD40-like Beta Propeller Repeat n=1 Tax=Jiangella alba TaxID=561176 RepID=A0A1H5KL59_9ACTN|nr:hypothetical protein [Jiangella alba]SEE65354.1 hypothetical protein SAMN04488561_2123 [Jiangella alba]
MNVEHLLRAAVDDAVREVPPGFADGAIRRAVRARRRARFVAGGGAALVVAAAAAGVALVGPSAPRTDAPPAGTGDADVIDLGALPTGPAPEVPWYADGALHVGSQVTPTGIAWEARADRPVIQRVSDGYVVWTWGSEASANGDSTLTLVSDDGDEVVLADGRVTTPAVSPGGELIAWGVPDYDWATDEQAREDGLTSIVMVYDAVTGEVVGELPDAPSPGARPKGFLDDGRVVVEAAANESWGTYAWAPGGEVALLREDLGVRAVSPGGLAVLGGTTGPAEVTDLATGTTLWGLADGYLHQFSPDGRYLAMVETWDSVERPDDVVILDARTGAEMGRFTFQAANALRWESPTSVVIEAHDDASAALVRCTVGDACESATEVRPADPDPDAFDNPYVLG